MGGQGFPNSVKDWGKEIPSQIEGEWKILLGWERGGHYWMVGILRGVVTFNID